MAGQNDDPHARRRWFLNRRGKAHGGIPDGAYLKALQHHRRLRAESERRLRAKSATAFGPPESWAVNWTPLGPAAINHGQATSFPIVSGRITALAVGPGGERIYAGAANGGVWFSSDAGNTWTPLDEWAYLFGLHEGVKMDALSVGALAVFFGAAADGSADTIYIGTGEPIDDGYMGSGVKYFTQGGQSRREEAFNLAGKAIYRIVIDPAQPTTAFAATSAGLYHRDVTTSSWPQVPVVSGHPGAVVSDIVVVSSGTKTFYAACPGFGIYSSTDGTNWHLLDAEEGAFDTAQRIALAATEGDPPEIYAFTDQNTLYRWEAANGGLFLGVSGVPPNEDLLGEQGTYDLMVAVDPANDDTIYLGGSTVEDQGNFSASLYKGTLDIEEDPSFHYTFPFVSPNNDDHPTNDPTWIGRNIHADVHAIAFATNSDNTTHNGSIVWIGTDGGVFASLTGGGRSSYLAHNSGLSITQLTYLAQRTDTDAVLYAGCQDNGCIRFWGEPAWYESPQGDGGGIAIDPNNPRHIMSQYINGSLSAALDGGLSSASWADVSPPLYAVGTNPVDPIESNRTAFYAPIRAIADGGTTIAVFGTNRLWKTTDWGSTWQTLPSNTTPASGNANQDVLDDLYPTHDPDATHPTSYITAIWMATPALIYVATESGLWKFLNANNTWTKSSIPIPDGVLPINCIGGAASDSPNLYIGSGSWSQGTVRYYEVVGQTAFWRSFHSTPVSCLVVDPKNPNFIYLGTETGVAKVVRSGTPGHYTWEVSYFSYGLPGAAVLDLIIHPDARLLRAATYGRGAWEIPLDATPAQNFDIYVRTDYADSGRLNPATKRRYSWVDGIPDPTRPYPANATSNMSADIKVQRAAQTPQTLPLDFAGYAGLPYSANTMDAQGTNQLFVQVHNRSSTTLPAVDVTVLVLLTDASTGIPQLPAGYAANIATPVTSPGWLGNDWKFASLSTPFLFVTIPSSRLSAVVEYNVDLSALGLNTATTLCTAVFISSAGDILASTEQQLDALTLIEKKVAYRLFQVA